VSVKFGADATPNGIKSGVSSIVGTDILQRIIPKPESVGVVYHFRVKFTTSAGRKLVGYEDIQVRRF
jgi:hypothetical protein